TRNLIIEVGYMGNQAEKLQVNRQIDGIPLQYLSTSPVRDQANIDRMTASVTNPFAGLIPGTGLDGSLVSRGQLVRPFPNFTGISAQQLNDGSSNFHALDIRIEKRFSRNLQFVSNFQRAKLLERRSRHNDADPVLEKRVATEDRSWRLVASGSYDLPFGRGQSLFSRINPGVSQVIS